MKYFEISIPKALLVVSEEEVLRLIKQDTEMFMIACKRGKSFLRNRKQTERERQKFEQEGTP
jgi:hypothetical protein